MRCTIVRSQLRNAVHIFHLVSFLLSHSPYVRSQAASVLVNVVRLNPSLNIMVLPYLSRMLKRVDDAAARASLVWMIGEYADSIVEAPYMLEQIINNYEEEQSVLIKLQLLTASMKVFFKRPPEMHAMLGRLFACALNETNNQDLHDRALLYYRLLSSNVNTAEAVFKTTPSKCFYSFIAVFFMPRRSKLQFVRK